MYLKNSQITSYTYFVSLYLTGERYDFVIHANQPPGDYWIQLRGLGECATGDMQQLGILRYEGHHRKLLSAPPSYNISLYDGVVRVPKINVSATFQLIQSFLYYPYCDILALEPA